MIFLLQRHKSQGVFHYADFINAAMYQGMNAVSQDAGWLAGAKFHLIRYIKFHKSAVYQLFDFSYIYRFLNQFELVDKNGFVTLEELIAFSWAVYKEKRLTQEELRTQRWMLKNLYPTDMLGLDNKFDSEEYVNWQKHIRQRQALQPQFGLCVASFIQKNPCSSGM